MRSSTDTNNGPTPANRTPWLGAALLLVALLRLWRLPETGPLDYDSVHNWQIVQAMARGNFAQLFHHGSPVFFLLYLPVAACTREFVVFQAINALLGVAGLGLFATWAAQKASLTGPEAAGLALLGGTSLLLTFSGRDFTMGSADLVLFALLLRSHYARLQRPSAAAVLRVAGWLALGLSVDYKFLFAVPILVLLEVIQADGLWRQTRNLSARVLLVLAVPYVVLGAVGIAAGQPWYRWLGFYMRTVVPKAANAAGRQSTLHLDGLYYFRYLASFESPLLLLGLGLAGVLAWRAWRNGWRAWAQPWLLAYLLVWAACFLAGMSLLIKAPRGLLFAYLPLAALAVLGGRRVLPSYLLMGVVLAAVGQNVYRIQQALYAPLPSRYPAVAVWLQQHGATKVASTVGVNLAPYLCENQILTTITDERQLAGLRRQGYQYVLLDGYWRVAGIARFDSLRRQVPMAAWPAPELEQPLLFLEHSEFTGLGYIETLAASRAAAADSLPLRLYRLR